MKLTDKTKDILEWIICIIIAFVLALLVRYYIGTPTIVKMPSMYPTLKQDQRLILNRWCRTIKEMPSRGDIITFEAPTSDSYIFSKDFNPNDVVAKYSNEKTKILDKFIYNVLEVNKASYIKRVIALPGEHLQIKDGKVYINDVELQEDYLQPQITTSTENCPFYDLVVPENCVFVMGDNRNHSSDSRSYKVGLISEDQIIGKAEFIVKPFDRIGKI